MDDDRVYAFLVGDTVATKAGDVVGKIIDRAPDADRLVTVEVTRKTAAQYKTEPGRRIRLPVPVNAYRLEYMSDHGRPATDWWQEDMLVKA